MITKPPLEPGAVVIMQGWGEYSALFVELARQLKRNHSCQIHLYVGIDSDVPFYSSLDDGRLFASVVHAHELQARCLESLPPRTSILQEARASEEWLGIHYNELAVANRHLGRGFALGGFYFPRSRMSESTDYWSMLHGFNREIAFWRRELSEKRPALTINLRKHAAVVGRKLGIEQRWLALSRYKNFHYWAYNEFYETPAFQLRFDRIAHAPRPEITRPYNSHMDLRKAFVERMSLRRTLRLAIRMMAQRAYWRLRGFQKGRNYYLREELAMIFRARRQLRQSTQGKHDLGTLADQPFVYFPLHTEPEAALQGLSPEYFFQLSCIASLARDLPAGVLLAVKETYAAVGKRPDNFYDQIREFKNVVLLDTMILGLDVIRHARAVATISGTAGFEAAVMGKPVIAFGHHNIYNFLPHVTLITDTRELKSALLKAIAQGAERASAVQDGACFLAAVVEESFDLGQFDLRRRHHIDPTAGELAYNALLATLSPSHMPKESAGL